jgi:hypothetical protein
MSALAIKGFPIKDLTESASVPLGHRLQCRTRDLQSAQVLSPSSLQANSLPIQGGCLYH